MKLFRDSQGQSLLVTIFALAALMILGSAVVDTSLEVASRIKYQTIADGSSLQSAVVVADGLNMIALTNATLIGMGIAAFFSDGATLKFVRNLQNIQDRIIAYTPASAVSLAMIFEPSQAPQFRLVTKIPEMRAKRAYLNLLFWKIPLWCKDDKAISRRKTIITMVDWSDRHWITNGCSYPEGGRLIGTYILWPLPSPTYEAHLVSAK